MKRRVIPAVVMLAILFALVAAEVVTRWPIMAILVIVVIVLCGVELVSFHEPEPSIVDQFVIIVVGGIAALSSSEMLPGDVIVADARVPNYVAIIVWVLISSIVLENTIALFVGKSWTRYCEKKHVEPWRMYRKYSPNKTVAGSVSGVVGGIAIGYALVLVLHCFAHMSAEVFDTLTVLSFTTPILSEFGDWVESRMKRKVGVKDSNDKILEETRHGALWHFEKALGGHGGFVDRTDSLFMSLIAVPFAIMLVSAL
jgi:CDP-diglyceride synthetase